MSKRLNKQIVDVGGGIPALSAYAFLGVAGSVTLTGTFRDSSGYQVGTAVSVSILQGDGSNAPAMFPAIPEAAVGFEGALSGDVYVSVGGKSQSLLQDFKVNYASYRTVLESSAITFGSVSAASEGSSGGSGLSPSMPGAIVDSALVNGATVTKVITDTGADCKGVWTALHNGMYDMAVTDVATGASAPTLTATTGHVFKVPPATDRLLDIGANRDVYAITVSGTADAVDTSWQVRS